MEEKRKKVENRYSLEFSDEENAALAVIAATEPYKSMAISKRQAIRFAILSLAGNENSRKDELVSLLEGHESRIRDLIVGTVAAAVVLNASKAAPGRPAKQAAAEGIAAPARGASDEDKDAIGTLICDSLNGTVQGRSCIYKKFEVTAAGRAISYELTEPLANLTQGDIDKQYDPSKDSWDAANA